MDNSDIHLSAPSVAGQAYGRAPTVNPPLRGNSHLLNTHRYQLTTASCIRLKELASRDDSAVGPGGGCKLTRRCEWDLLHLLRDHATGAGFIHLMNDSDVR
jgi:hypothetical protein